MSDTSVEETAVATEAPAPPADPWQQKYHPYELPSNPVAAAAVPAELIDPSVEIEPDRAVIGKAAIEAAAPDGNHVAIAAMEGQPEPEAGDLAVSAQQAAAVEAGTMEVVEGEVVPVEEEVTAEVTTAQAEEPHTRSHHKKTAEPQE